MRVGRSTIRGVITVAALALVFSACGGSDGDSEALSPDDPQSAPSTTEAAPADAETLETTTTAPPTTTEPPTPTLRVSFADPDGFSYSGELPFIVPEATFRKDISESPPGEARLYVSFDQYSFPEVEGGTGGFNRDGERVSPMALLPTNNGERSGDPASVSGGIEMLLGRDMPSDLRTLQGLCIADQNTDTMVCSLSNYTSGSSDYVYDADEADVDEGLILINANDPMVRYFVNHQGGGCVFTVTTAGSLVNDLSSCNDISVELI